MTRTEALEAVAEAARELLKHCIVNAYSNRITAPYGLSIRLGEALAVLDAAPDEKASQSAMTRREAVDAVAEAARKARALLADELKISADAAIPAPRGERASSEGEP